MKNLFILFIAIFMAANSAFAQHAVSALTYQSQVSGLFLTSEDFQAHKISHTDARIRLNEFLNSANISVTENGKTIRFAKKDIYAYRDQHGRDFRFQNNLRYRILDTTGFYLYENPLSVPAGKGRVLVPAYYFSVTPGTPLQALSLRNLRRAFAQDVSFLDQIDNKFNNDAALASFDEINHGYKLQRAYKRAEEELLSAHNQMQSR
ncbi:hypothetical protein SNE25_03995 [Mucilaginibacter sabulilitoris]|uniref:DUF4468 domain-containing protein n=1 Tax=Mucilaginibacter sabulilitoris TaxID=1173583 RepID=A0ABZ0TPF5_9SPHI|nr:hypothetical protein [Mucilaginibacter sabulilitoris]WPU94681.1 hypothetical protein SNE25_03995 [Mucilaginibacter sabulilitoris]